MNEHSEELQENDELRIATDRSFFDKNPLIRALIGLCFGLVLFIVLHFREVRVEILEVNANAPNYVVAQVDFDFFDEEATIILKQEAVRDIGKIYRLSENEVRQRRIDFENSLIYSEEWRNKASETSLAAMYQATDQFQKALTQLRFTDPRTFQKIRGLNQPSEDYQIYTPANINEQVILPQQVWSRIILYAFSDKKFSPDIINYLTKYFEKTEWMMEDDIPSQRALRRLGQSKVPDKFTHVNAGSRIIDQGEKVTTRHVAMLQAMKNALREKRNLWHPLTLGGSLILTLLLLGLSIVYFDINHPKLFASNRQLLLLVTIISMTLGIAELTEYFILTSKNDLVELIHYPIFVPIAAILLCSLVSQSIAFFASGFLSIVLMLTLAFERQDFLIINLATAFASILNAQKLHRRKDVFIVCGKAWLCGIAIIFSIHFYQQASWSTGLATDIAVSGVFMLFTAVLVLGLLPLFESAFRIMTDVTLMEYMDPNHELMRRLSIEAPGTYQHSVVVGNLAESAAVAIGANGLFCRVATMYHDIGKIATPQYFTENQCGGMDIHQLLTPKESAQVIMAHVSEGVSMAVKAGLPEQFIDIIKEHHGTTLVYYFYRKQVNKMGGDESLVDEADFRYNGPTPRGKESAIIMIADSLEAASRSLEKADEESLDELATRLIRYKSEDGQFDHCLLTFEELAIVKETLVKTLVAFNHARVKFPKREIGSQPTPVYNGG